ncbi:MAG: UDP-N-acetylglucosamine 2-epimerase (non-hydrolyzing) [Candidatus Parabeggiatoa sp. nov. 1]|nr:MAG: UDP-N-acetylglucosamine 2-epimerase (non-hydrolyzing) [Gammaproteobacteria bacterium]
MKTIHLIAAARPNFMKIAPLYHALKKYPEFKTVIIHTGQHYDFNMSQAFIRDLGLPDADVNLGVGSGTHAQQTAGVMVAYENYLMTNSPDWIIVVGDVNSTMACTLAAKKLNFKVAHLEAGLRSFDRTMPEEINRIVTDSLADVLWTPSPDGDENLIQEGIQPSRIKRVGNIMLDSFLMLKAKIDAQKTWEKFNLTPSQYGVVTIHRPSNTDEPNQLKEVVQTLVKLSTKLPLVIPLHPRTQGKLLSFKLMDKLNHAQGIILSEPLGYIEFMGLLQRTRLVVTDSGGLQEETTFMDIPCLTLRKNTERPMTCSQGTNELVSLNDLEAAFESILSGDWKKTAIPELWDGKTAQRVVEDIMKR